MPYKRNVDEDGVLIRRYLEGDAGAFDELYRRHGSPLFAFFLVRCRDRARAEDLLQELFLRVVTHLPRYRHSGRFRGWLFRIAHRLLIDEARRRGGVVLVSSDAPVGAGDHPAPLGDSFAGPERLQPEQAAERGEAAAAATRALGRLSPAQREVFQLRQAGVAFKEIANIQGVSINTALGRMHDAVTSLRRQLQGEHT